MTESPKGEKRPTPPANKPRILSLDEIFGEAAGRPYVAPTRRNGHQPWVAVTRSHQHRSPPDVTGLSPFWCLIGRGGTGKTMLARLLASFLAEKNISNVVLAALDPGHRMLAEFVNGVRQPDNADPAVTAAFLRRLIDRVMKHRLTAIADFGGGDTALNEIIRSAPDLPRAMEDAGVAMVAAYFFTPSADDAFVLEDHAALGFTPKATALVLNAHHATTPSAFDAVRAHPAYRAALDRGAVEIVLPRLAQDVAQKIEAHRYHFHEARDGLVPTGNPHPPLDLSLLEQTMVRGFLEEAEGELKPLEAAGWMPWT